MLLRLHSVTNDQCMSDIYSHSVIHARGCYTMQDDDLELRLVPWKPMVE